MAALNTPTKISLFPSGSSVAVSTEKFEIAFISLPILETAIPCPLPILWSYLAIWVFVVYIKNTRIVVSALCAFAAKITDQFQFPIPYCGVFIDKISVFVPVRLLARLRTESCVTRFSTLFAHAVLVPTMFQITLLGAVNNGVFSFRSIEGCSADNTDTSSPVALGAWAKLSAEVGRYLGLAGTRRRTKQAACSSNKWLSTVLANVFHTTIIIGIWSKVKDYFSIAEKRIRNAWENRQGKLF